jgi:hypothetical protein
MVLYLSLTNLYVVFGALSHKACGCLTLHQRIVVNLIGLCVLVLVLDVGTYSLVADCLNVSTEQQLPVGSYFSFP